MNSKNNEMGANAEEQIPKHIIKLSSNTYIPTAYSNYIPISRLTRSVRLWYNYIVEFHITWGRKGFDGDPEA